MATQIQVQPGDEYDDFLTNNDEILLKTPELLEEEEALYLDEPEQDVTSATHGYEFTDMARDINIFEMSDAFIGSFYFDD